MGPAVAACYDPDCNPIRAWQAKSICKQLLTALKCLHDLGITQSDSNPGNLLLSLTIPIQQPSSGGKCWSTGVKGNPQIPERIYENRPLTEFWDREVPVKLMLSDLGAGTYRRLVQRLLKQTVPKANTPLQYNRDTITYYIDSYRLPS